MPIFDISASPPYRAGATQLFLENWREITSDHWILSSIRGISIPFEFIPYQDRVPFPYKLSPDELTSLNFELNIFLEKGVIEPALEEEGQWISNLFLRPKNNGRNRVILDLTELNKCVKYEKFKMSNLITAIELMSPHCYMASIDLSDAYYSLPILEKFRKYFRFYWKGVLYQFVGMPNGLACAPRMFTKIMVPIFSHLREKDVICFNYLDDSFIMDYDKDACKTGAFLLAATLQNLGFFVHPDKSVFEPNTTLEFLGFNLDSNNMIVSLTDDKLDRFRNFAQWLLKRKSPKIRDCAKMIGIMTAYSAGVDYGAAHIKNLEKIKNIALAKNQGNFEARMRLNIPAKGNIFWWLDNINNTRKIRYDSQCQVLYTDASTKGWGATCDDLETGGRWDVEEKEDHINVLELKAIYFGLKCLWDGHSEIIKVYTDNTTALAYVNKKGGVRSDQCNEVAQDIWAWCENNELMIAATHIPGVENIAADFRSRNFSDGLEWELKNKHYKRICKIFGNPDVDLFATRLNKKCEHFVSWLPDPEALDYDAFSFAWTDDKLYYAFPPFNLVRRCLQKVIHERQMRRRRANVILLAPLWPSQAYFPVLRKLAIRTIEFRKDLNLINPHVSGLERVPLIACLC